MLEYDIENRPLNLPPGRLWLRKIAVRAVGLLYRLRFALFSGAAPAFGLFALRRVRGTGFSADTLVWPGTMVVKLRNPLMRVWRDSHPNERRNKTALLHDLIEGRFAREYDMLRRLSEMGLSPRPIAHGPYFVVMEHVDALPLHTCLDDRPHLMRLVTGAIERMHKAGLHHGDLTMGNILVDSRDRVYFIDFETAFAAFVSLRDRDTLDYVFFLRRFYRRYPALAARHAAGFCREILEVHPDFASEAAKFADYMAEDVTADIREAQKHRITAEGAVP